MEQPLPKPPLRTMTCTYHRHRLDKKMPGDENKRSKGHGGFVVGFC